MLLKPDYDVLWIETLLVGISILLLSGLSFSKKFSELWKKFPRSIVFATIFTIVDSAWVCLWLYEMQLGPLEPLQPYLSIISILIPVSVLVFLRELLACRAFGVFLSLLATPLLSAADWHPSAWRLVVPIFSYAIVIESMFVIALPWVLRNQINWVLANDTRRIAINTLFFIFGLLLTVLSLSVYR